MGDTSSFEEKGMLAIIAISGSTGLVLHFAYDVPWFSAGAVPTHVVFLLGMGLPIIFASVAYLIKKKEIPTQYQSFNEAAYTQLLKSQQNSGVESAKHAKIPTFDSEAAFKRIPYLPEFEVDGRLEPTEDDLKRIALIEERMKLSFTQEMFEGLELWAKYYKGLRSILLQFSRARPGRLGVSDIEECFSLLTKASKWRYNHNIPLIFQRGYDSKHRIELKKRFLNSFFYGAAADVGDPIYYNCMGQADMDHTDLVPGRFTVNDLSVMWVQEMEYREKVLFPSYTKSHGKLVNYMYVVFDAKDASMGRLKLLSYLKPTAGLNSEFYPESVRQILVVNCPSMITWLFSFVKPLIPETTQKKVVFISGNGREELLALTKDEKMIPKEYGGKGPSRHDIVVDFQNELNAYLEQQEGYDSANDEQAKDRKLRAGFLNLAEKEK